jgi:sugar phosphate isomerase/epimerase
MTTLTRKQFIKISSLSAAAITLTSLSSFESKPKAGLQIGLCGFLEKSEFAKKAGCEYLEGGTAKILMPAKPEQEFLQTFNTLSAQSLQVKCFNVFIPGELKSVGDHAQHDEIVNYATTAFARAERIGADIIVFGSSGSRSIPDGFDRDKAKEQFTSLCKKLAPIAAKHNITIALENLNKGETNFINKLNESAEIVEAVNHPHLKMMCDIYHALKENDPPSELIRFKEHIVHLHIAEKEKRTPPGVMGDDFTPYFKALKKINYRGRISLECNWKDLETELTIAVYTLREQFSKA